MGRMGGEAIYVRSLYQPIAFLVLAIGIGFGVAAQVSAAISRGSNRPQDVLPTVWSMARVWILLGVSICLTAVISAPGLAALLDVDPASRAAFVSFMRWTPVAELAGVAGGLCTASLRGYGYAGAAMVVTVAAGAVKLSCVVALGLGAGIGVMSIPVAAALSAVVSLFAGVVLLRRRGLWQPLDVRTWRPEVLGRLWQIGVPVAVTFLIIAAYNGAVLSVLVPYGPKAVSGYSIAATVQALVVLPGTLLGAATAILINQQRGAGRLDALGRTSRAGLELSFVLYAPLALVVWLAAGPIGHIMTNESEIANEAAHYLTVVALTYVVQGPVLAGLTLMEHTGRGFLAAALNMIYFAAIVLVGWFAAARVQGADGLYVSVAVCNLMGVIVPIVAYRSTRGLRTAAG
jgi:Na+-driven multidrug efflux pump